MSETTTTPRQSPQLAPISSNIDTQLQESKQDDTKSSHNNESIYKSDISMAMIKKDVDSVISFTTNTSATNPTNTADSDTTNKINTISTHNTSNINKLELNIDSGSDITSNNNDNTNDNKSISSTITNKRYVFC